MAPRRQTNEAPSGGVYVHGFAQQNSRVLLTPEEGTKRGRDFARRKGPSGNLIQQWLKKMEVTAVDESHVGGGLAQGHGRVQAAESSAENHDAVRYTRSRHA